MNLIQDVLRAAESKPEQDRFVRVKLEDILPDPENFYNTDEIEELAAAIDAFGLEQPLVVRPADDEPGKYRLTGGHRRRLALLTLYAKDPDRWREVDARLTTSLGALADQARLILMNRTARKETEYENMMETVKTAEIAREFKAGGGKVEGKTRAAVAAALGISSAQAGKYQAIYKHLCPTLMQRYKAGVIGTQVAYELSSLPKRQQEEIAATYPVPTLEAVRKKKESAPETFPDWALPMAKEFVNKKWVRKLEHFSAAALQALATNTGGTNNCGGITGNPLLHGRTARTVHMGAVRQSLCRRGRCSRTNGARNTQADRQRPTHTTPSGTICTASPDPTHGTPGGCRQPCAGIGTASGRTDRTGH